MTVTFNVPHITRTGTSCWGKPK